MNDKTVIASTESVDPGHETRRLGEGTIAIQAHDPKSVVQYKDLRFRLFKGEASVRNARANAARVEAFSNVGRKRGDWQEWSGTCTVVKPHGATVNGE